MHLSRYITEVILGSKASFIFILCYFFLRLEQHKLSLMAEEWRSGNLVHKLLPKHHFKSQNWASLVVQWLKTTTTKICLSMQKTRFNLWGSPEAPACRLHIMGLHHPHNHMNQFFYNK